MRDTHIRDVHSLNLQDVHWRKPHCNKAGRFSLLQLPRQPYTYKTHKHIPFEFPINCELSAPTALSVTKNGAEKSIII